MDRGLDLVSVLHALDLLECTLPSCQDCLSDRGYGPLEACSSPEYMPRQSVKWDGLGLNGLANR